MFVKSSFIIKQNKMESIKEALEIITGGKSTGYYLAGFFFCCVGILLSWYLASRKRDPQSPSTPYRFDWWFLIWDNMKKATVTLLLQFLMFRMFDLSNVFAMIGVGFFLSMGLDKVIEYLMEKTNLLNFLERDREKFKKDANPKP